MYNWQVHYKLQIINYAKIATVEACVKLLYLYAPICQSLMIGTE